jgi:methyl-accepting chemotaxis protein
MRLGKRLMIGSIILTVFPLFIVWIFFISRGSDMLKDMALGQLVSVRRSLNEFVENSLAQEKRILKNFNSDQMVQKGADMIMRAVPDLAQTYFDKYNTIYHDKTNYGVFLITDSSGKIVADTLGGIYKGQALADQSSLKSSPDSDPVIGAVEKSQGNPYPVVYLTTPLLKIKDRYLAENTRVGTMAVKLRLNSLNRKLKDIKIGRTGFAMIVDQSGKIIAHPNSTLVLSDIREMFKFKDITARILGLTESISEVRQDGIEKVLVYAPIKGASWSLVLVVPKSEYLSTVNSMTNTIVFVMILFSSLTLIGVRIFFSRAVYGPISDLSTYANKVSVGDIGFVTARAVSGKLRKKERKDEIGDLTSSFNEMAKYISEAAENAKLISQGDLDRKVTPRSENDALGNAFNEMVHYLQQTARVAQLISQGNLAVSVTSKSEKDVLGIALASMVANLREIVAKIQTSSNTIHSKANEMASLSTASNETMSQMASNVSQISVSISKISSITQNIVGVAQKTSKLAENGDKTINAISQKVLRSMMSVAQAAEVIRNLDKGSSQIGDIISYITKVADQTNLLSLNAAIEAARAGEAGLGFAVVADEVRKLAEGSAQSASRIGVLINEVQLETSKAVSAVEAVSKEVDESANVTGDASKSFRDITQASHDIAEQIKSLAVISEETAANAEEASASSQEQVATFEEITNSIETLKNIAESLKESAAKFKLTAEINKP